MSAPRCWICNRKMRLNRNKDGWWLHCGPCAATYMDVHGWPKGRFLAGYDMFYREKRGDNQLSLFDEVNV